MRLDKYSIYLCTLVHDTECVFYFSSYLVLQYYYWSRNNKYHTVNDFEHTCIRRPLDFTHVSRQPCTGTTSEQQGVRATLTSCPSLVSWCSSDDILLDTPSIDGGML